MVITKDLKDGIRFTSAFVEIETVADTWIEVESGTGSRIKSGTRAMTESWRWTDIEDKTGMNISGDGIRMKSVTRIGIESETGSRSPSICTKYEGLHGIPMLTELPALTVWISHPHESAESLPGHLVIFIKFSIALNSNVVAC
ncbi:hypothetical protein EVAR_14913_1 [Eumeta japonica]|uniref:Uncharacterized protein n=1 Tax=Eumeta variegata TaxID=151549 RepID=A0A4C1XQ67_EUMVA|nr:hypothetical protein EVAR_14913_1 [Eumeta japonica]